MGLIGAMGTNHGNKIISETEVLVVWDAGYPGDT